MMALCCVLTLNMTALAFEGEKEMPQANLAGVIAQAEMDDALKGETKDHLYLRYNEEEIIRIYGKRWQIEVLYHLDHSIRFFQNQFILTLC